jgi:hypothetical protein
MRRRRRRSGGGLKPRPRSASGAASWMTDCNLGGLDVKILRQAAGRSVGHGIPGNRTWVTEATGSCYQGSTQQSAAVHSVWYGTTADSSPRQCGSVGCCAVPACPACVQCKCVVSAWPGMHEPVLLQPSAEQRGCILDTHACVLQAAGRACSMACFLLSTPSIKGALM